MRQVKRIDGLFVCLLSSYYDLAFALFGRRARRSCQCGLFPWDK